MNSFKQGCTGLTVTQHLLYTIAWYYLVVTTPIVITQEANESYKCLSESNYKREACQEYFRAYKDCKKRMVSNTTYSQYNALSSYTVDLGDRSSSFV